MVKTPTIGPDITAEGLRTSCSLPSEMWMKLGMLPLRSSNVCIFTAALVERKRTHHFGPATRHSQVRYSILARLRGNTKMVEHMGAEGCFDRLKAWTTPQ
jgi:hypothetical protein